jgi:hypothetical protein
VKPAIGGVLPALEPRSVEHNLWDRWTAGFTHTAAFSSARSAMAALLRQRQPKRLWLPAYVCQTVLDGAAGWPVDWYAVDGALRIVPPALEPGDAVLVINYFGRPARFEAPGDVLVIEDRAQALDPGAPAFGDVVLYSPRKLLGVGDGGLLASNQPLPQPGEPPTDGLWNTNDARAQDPDGFNPGAWRPAFIAREAGFEPDNRAMTPRTETALRGFDPAGEIAARQANWSVLSAGLADIALWPVDRGPFAPLAFPILADDAGKLAAHLADQRIWAPRHWAELPSPASFTAAHDLARRCLSLPLDGRYGPVDMARIVEAVQSYPR